MTTAQSQQPSATETGAVITLDLVFLGADGFPIEGLEGRAIVDGEVRTFITDAKGTTDTLHATPEAEVQVHVMRMDGSYKELQSCEAGHTNACWSFISPSVFFDATTQLHQGEPGTVAQEIPKWETGDEGERDKGKETIEGAAPFEEGFTPTQVVLGQTPSAAQKSAPPVQATTSAPKKPSIPDPTKAKSTEATQAAQIEGRDAHGNPIVVFTHKVKDWWGAWHFPTWSLSWGAQAATTAAGGGQAVGASGIGNNPGMEKQLKALIEFAEEQITYDYSGKEGTASVYAQMKNGTFKHVKGERRVPRTGPGRCYQWVRVALARAGVTDGFLADEKTASLEEQESASKAGGPLMRKGFTDVTATLPDARWAAAGDVIVYTWTPETWEKRKLRKNNPDLPNFGHIDIRSYESYISDFIPESRHPNWVEYTHIRIYRKVFDPLPTARIRAFLHCLRDFECQAEPDDSKRYNILNTALPSNPNSKRFSGFKIHPWATVPDDQRGTATAAGAYQFVYKTWKSLFQSGAISVTSGADMFSPAVQDRLAVIALEGRGALPHIRLGKIEDAIKTLLSEWTSLPGAKENAKRRTADGKPMDMTHFVGLFNTYLVQEKAKEKIQ
jgi:muramidase (phage lysozyme)